MVSPKAPTSKKRKVRADADEGTSIRDDSTWVTGDYALISSDSVRFRVDLVHLLSSSSVFRDMASVAAQGADREIHFTDDTIETSEVFKRFLPLLISATVDVKDIQRPKNLNPLVFMTRFLVKYDCPFLMAVLGLRLKEYMSNGRSGLYTFIIGSNMGDTDLCMSALSGKTRTWSESSEPDTNSEKSPPTFNCLNPQALRFSWWSMIPAPYLYALNRAWGLVGDSPNLKTKFREVLDDVQTRKH